MLGAETLCGTRLSLGGFFFAVAGRCTRLKRAEKSRGNGRDVVDRGLKRVLVGLRRLVEAADLADELKRGRANFFFRDRWLEVKKDFDVAAHSNP